MPKVDGLTDKRERFCQEYVKDLNATQAAIRAGYSENGAAQKGSALLRIVKVSGRVRELIAAELENADLTPEMVIAELRRIGFSKMDDFAEWDGDDVTLLPSEDLDEDAARCISEVSQTITKDGGSIRFKLHDKVQALDKLGKYFKLFTDAVDVTHHGEVAITEVRIVRPKEEGDD